MLGEDIDDECSVRSVSARVLYLSSHAQQVTCRSEKRTVERSQGFTSPQPHRHCFISSTTAVSSLIMLFFRRYPRFTLLLSFLLTASLLLLLTHTPFPSLQPSSAPPTQPVNPTGFQELAARVRRAERAYQKMLLGRDALITKVGPTPHNVALCALHYRSSFFF